LFVKRCQHVVNPDPGPGQKTVVNESVITEKLYARLREGAARVGSAHQREGAQRGGGVAALFLI